MQNVIFDSIKYAQSPCPWSRATSFLEVILPEFLCEEDGGETDADEEPPPVGQLNRRRRPQRLAGRAGCTPDIDEEPRAQEGQGERIRMLYDIKRSRACAFRPPTTPQPAFA